MAKLVYMDQVIKETLRMYPSAPFILRKLQDDVKIGNYIYISILIIYSLSYSTQIYFTLTVVDLR